MTNPKTLLPNVLLYQPGTIAAGNDKVMRYEHAAHVDRTARGALAKIQCWTFQRESQQRIGVRDKNSGCSLRSVCPSGRRLKVAAFLIIPVSWEPVPVISGW